MTHNLKLQWQADGQNYERIIAMGSEVVLGRSDSASIILSDPHVSRHHASVAGRDGQFFVSNLSQSNPVFVQTGSEVKQLAHQETLQLSVGQVIRVGKVEITVVSIEEAVKPRQTVVLKIRCSNCERVVEAKYKDCPWCGTALAFGSTFYS